MNLISRTIGVFVITGVAAISGYAQDDKTSQTSSNQQTANQTYVFPTEKERLKRYINNMVGPFRLVRTAASAGIDQWRDSPEEWGQGMKGYGKRYASGLGQNAIQQTVTYGLDEAMGLDTGFERSKREGFFPRLKDALIQNVTSRKRNGDRVVSVPRFAGVYTGAIVARETWYPDRYTFKDGLRSGTTTLLTGFGINLVREFVINW
ncbi:MAG TPA: hypothetical protein VFI24_29370 [Pyrinomonadaceae bacterium]|nr:hypothetical protein [Pyrinomonadaceae bacterium]